MATLTQEILLTIIVIISLTFLADGILRWQFPDLGLHFSILLTSLVTYFLFVGLILPNGRYYLWGLFFTAGFFSASLTVLTTKLLTRGQKPRRKGMQRKRTREDLLWYLQLGIMAAELFVFYELFPNVLQIGGWLLTYHLPLP